MYERKRGLMEQPLGHSIPFVGGRSPAAVIEQLGVAREAGMYQEASVYCGRVLLAIEIEERSEKKEPSPAQIAMKPKDCIDLWYDLHSFAMIEKEIIDSSGSPHAVISRV